MEVDSTPQTGSTNTGDNKGTALQNTDTRIFKDYLKNPDEILNSLAESTLARYRTHPPTHRLLIGVSGVPGSGKTTLARNVVEKINLLTQKQLGITLAVMLPMDGYHNTRKELDAMSNPAEAHQRRGAPFTFDVDKFKELLELLKNPVVKEGDKEAKIVYAASFDHAVKDPIKDDIAILPSHRIVIVEGNYLCLSPPPASSLQTADWTHPSPKWAEISSLFDESWFVETESSVVRERLAKRHFDAGIVKTLKEAEERADGSDRRNGDDILRWRLKPDVTIIS